MIHRNCNTVKNTLFMLSIFFTSILGIFISDIYIPSLNSISKELKINESLLSFSVTTYFIVFAIFQLIYGYLSDRFGRRKIFLLGLIISIIGTIIVLFSTTFFFLLFGRILEAIGMASPMALGKIIIRESILDNKKFIKFMSFFNVSILIAPILAPMIGAILEIYFHWKADFIFILILNILCFYLSYYFLLETNTKLKKNTSIFNIAKFYIYPFKKVFFIKQIIISGFTIASILIYLSKSSFLFQDYFNMNMNTYSIVFFLCSSFILVGMLFNNIMIKYINIYFIQQISIIIFFFSSVLFKIQAHFFSDNIIAVVISIIGFNFSAGIIFNTSSILAILHFKKRLGIISGTYGCITMLIGSTLSSCIIMLPININILISTAFVSISFITVIISMSDKNIHLNRIN